MKKNEWAQFDELLKDAALEEVPPGWFSSAQIAERFKLSVRATEDRLTALVKRGVAQRQRFRNASGRPQFFYHIK